MNAFLESNWENSHDIIYTVSGRKLKVELERKETRGNTNTKGFISLSGPERMKVNIRSSSGRVFLSGIQHNTAEVRVSSGRMELSDIMVDKLKLTSSSGQIKGKMIGGDVEGSVSSGRVELEGVDGNVDFKGSSGRITLKEINGVVNVSTSSGSIDLTDVNEAGKLIVSSGKISGSNVGLGPNTYLKSSSGRVDITTSSNLNDYNFDFTAGSGSLTVGNVKKGKRLNLNNNSNHTISGSVSSGRLSITN
ncbi:DUF4097 family beta strand repeat protein [Litoribacter ruber]|uniref:DUF4097 family beta strand repeat-containing protein n=1 Tax=Litoribacter ruber TaxID=702568 RepID=UPI001BD9AE18|nr:DUF4097 family beta strand repeat-containing protein [Litoribacter ruber]MBT0810203.1 DUF4097 family beta strand repeat protein [Litoribacter ruber]